MSSTARNQATILVVDDSAIIRHLIAEVLKNDFSLMMAASGEDGLKLIESHKPDLVLTDHIMPGMSGLELVQNFRQQESTSSIPAIILTSSNEPTLFLSEADRVIDDIIQKPFSKNDLIDKISNALARNNPNHIQANSPTYNNHFQMTGTKESFEEKLNKLIVTEIGNPNLKVGQLANGLSMSVSSFERYMKKYYGINPKLYVRKFRMEYAMELLKKHNWKIKKVARTVGFENDSYFAKCFRDRYGINPSDIEDTGSLNASHYLSNQKLG